MAAQQPTAAIFQSNPAPISNLGQGVAAIPQRCDPTHRCYRTQLHSIGGEQHPLKGLPKGGAISAAQQQPGPIPIHQHLSEGPQTTGGGGATAGYPAAGLLAFDGRAGLAV